MHFHCSYCLYDCTACTIVQSFPHPLPEVGNGRFLYPDSIVTQNISLVEKGVGYVCTRDLIGCLTGDGL
jgi:hypothetical protein